MAKYLVYRAISLSREHITVAQRLPAWCAYFRTFQFGDEHGTNICAQVCVTRGGCKRLVDFTHSKRSLALYIEDKSCTYTSRNLDSRSIRSLFLHIVVISTCRFEQRDDLRHSESFPGILIH